MIRSNRSRLVGDRSFIPVSSCSSRCGACVSRHGPCGRGMYGRGRARIRRERACCVAGSCRSACSFLVDQPFDSFQPLNDLIMSFSQGTSSYAMPQTQHCYSKHDHPLRLHAPPSCPSTMAATSPSLMMHLRIAGSPSSSLSACSVASTPGDVCPPWEEEVAASPGVSWCDAG